jgi:hypothetical protein
MSAERATGTSDWAKIPVGRGETLEAKEGVKNGEYALWQAEIGDVIRVTASTDDGDDYVYDFTVREAGEEPTVTIRQTGPDGKVIEDDRIEVILRGSGRWTNYRNNPMVRGLDEEMSIYYGTLFVGGETQVLTKVGRELYSLWPASTGIEIITPDYSEEVAS